MRDTSIVSDAKIKFYSELSYVNVTEGQTIRENVDTAYDAAGRGESLGINTTSPSRLESSLESPAVSECGDYKIIDVCNMEDANKNGLYVMMVEDAPGHATILIRGTNGDLTEWIGDDAALVKAGSQETPQQTAIREYMERIGNDPRFDGYTFTITGHSLGGQLAMHAAITADDAMKGRIDGVVSMDGPGFPQEYLDKYASEIDKLNGKMEHYQWSLVGNSLKQPGNVDNHILESANTYHEPLGLGRHDVNSIKIDENGNFVEGEMDPLAKVWGGISNTADFADTNIFTMILTVATLYFSIKTILPSLIKIGAVIALCDAVVEGIRCLWDAITKKQVSGTFDVDITALLRIAEEMETLSGEMFGVAADAEDIINSVQSKTADIWILKNHTKAIIDDIQKDAKNYGIGANIFINSSSNYHQVDGRVNTSYDGVKGTLPASEWG